MFVRWKKSPLKKKPGGVLLYASLVESLRIDGKPRQRTIAYLGSIAEADTLPGGRDVMVGVFWRAVRKRLAALALDEATADAILGKLAERVPVPKGRDTTADVLRATEANLAPARVVPKIGSNGTQS